MHGLMSGLYEVRIQGKDFNHRLFCVLVRDGADLGGSSIVALGGFSKPKRSPAPDREYKRILSFKSEFTQRRLVLELD